MFEITEGEQDVSRKGVAVGRQPHPLTDEMRGDLRTMVELVESGKLHQHYNELLDDALGIAKNNGWAFTSVAIWDYYSLNNDEIDESGCLNVTTRNFPRDRFEYGNAPFFKNIVALAFADILRKKGREVEVESVGDGETSRPARLTVFLSGGVC